MPASGWAVFDQFPRSVRELCNEYNGLTSVALLFKDLPEDKLLEHLNLVVEQNGLKRGPVAKRKSNRRH